MDAARIKTALSLLAACVCEAVEGSEEFCFCGIMPGDQWYDLRGDCSEDGCAQAWVRVVNLYPSSTFGQQDVSLQNCGKTTELVVELGVLRCVTIPTGGDQPEASDLLSDADQQIDDAAALASALQCCESFEDYSLGLWTPIGPGVGGIGGFWTATVDVV